MTEEQLAELYAYIQQTFPPPVQRYNNLLDAVQDPERESDAFADFSVDGEGQVAEREAEERDAPPSQQLRM